MANLGDLAAPRQFQPLSSRSLMSLAFEPALRDWQAEFAQRAGRAPQMPDQSYDYETALRHGVRPQRYEHDPRYEGDRLGSYHWQSSVVAPPYAQPLPLKSADHPTAWMETFMQQYGVDPHRATAEQLQDARQRGIAPDWGMQPLEVR